MQDFGTSYGRAWGPEALAQRARHVVADEADALMSSDAYWRPLRKLLDVRSHVDGNVVSMALGIFLARIADLPECTVAHSDRVRQFVACALGLKEEGAGLHLFLACSC